MNRRTTIHQLAEPDVDLHAEPREPVDAPTHLAPVDGPTADLDLDRARAEWDAADAYGQRAWALDWAEPILGALAALAAAPGHIVTRGLVEELHEGVGPANFAGTDYAAGFHDAVNDAVALFGASAAAGVSARG